MKITLKNIFHFAESFFLKIEIFTNRLFFYEYMSVSTCFWKKQIFLRHPANV